MSWQDDIRRLPDLSPREFPVRPAATALLLIDLQRVDADRDYGWGPMIRKDFPEVWEFYFAAVEQRVVPNARRLLEAFRDRGMRVIHITLGPELADASDMGPMRRPDPGAEGMASLTHHRGTHTAAILPELEPIEGELVINKTSRGAFNSTALERVLRNMEIETLVVAGVTASSCVETTARDAADRGFYTAMVEDATAELDQASFESTMRQFAHRWGRVWTTERVLQELGADQR